MAQKDYFLSEISDESATPNIEILGVRNSLDYLFRSVDIIYIPDDHDSVAHSNAFRAMSKNSNDLNIIFIEVKNIKINNLDLQTVLDNLTKENFSENEHLLKYWMNL